MSDEPARPPRRRSVLSLTWRFIRLIRPYLGLLLLALLVIMLVSSAKLGQTGLIKLVIDRFDTGRDLRDIGSKVSLTAEQSSRLREVMESTRARGDELEAERQGQIRDILTPEQLARLERRDLWSLVGTWDLREVAIAAIVLSFAMFLFGLLRDYLTNWLTNRVIADLRNSIIEHLSFLPLRFFHNRKSGDLISRVSNDVNVTSSAANFFFDDALVHPVMILWAVALIFYTNWMLAVAALVFFPLYVVPLVLLGRRLRHARKKSLERLGDMTGTMVQTFGGIKIVKAFNMEAAQAQEFRRHNEGYFRKFMSAVLRKALGENLAQLFMGLAVAAMLVGGYFLLARNVMTAGDLALFGINIAIINTSVRELSKSYNRLMEASTGCERVFELLDTPRETQHDRGDELDGLGRGVEVRGVSFAYDAEPVLRDISLTAAPGEVLALVGRSGAGKTTLCDLLCRFYDPTEGEILVGGRPLSRLRRSSLLRHVAVVTQDTFLFDASIADNIRYGRPGADRQAVEAAAKAANIHDFIMTLEKGYDSVVGDRGAKLSGGQRQRVAIARAVLKDPDILILDEATSALDSENEKLVQQAISRLIREASKKRITFIIAHRLSTVRDADRILVIDDGRLVEEGRHEELLAKGGAYAGLYRSHES